MNRFALVVVMVLILSAASASASSYLDDRSVVVNGNYNIVITGDYSYLEYKEKRTEDNLLVLPNPMLLGIYYAIIDNCVYECMLSSGKFFWDIYVTNSNDISVSIKEIYINVISYQSVKDAAIFSDADTGMEGEVEYQAYAGSLIAKSGKQSFLYCGEHDSEYIETDTMLPSGTYVRLNPGESESLCLVADYAPGIYKFTINIEYVIGDEVRTYTSDKYEVYFPNETPFEDLKLSGDIVGLIKESMYKSDELPEPMLNALKYDIQNGIRYDEITASASSTLLSKKYSYDASNVLDSDDSLAWVEGVPGYGIGEWVQLNFPKKQAVFCVKMSVGYHKSQSIYRKNSTPTRIRFDFSDNSSEEFEIPYAESVDDARMSFYFVDPKFTDYVRATILDVHPGEKYDDTCISSFSIYPVFE